MATTLEWIAAISAAAGSHGAVAYPPPPMKVSPSDSPIGYKIWYYHPDHLGSNSTVTDQSGAVVQERVFRAFGQMAHETAAPAFNPSFLFTDQARDRETGLDYFGARYFDSELGRFAQADSIVPDVGDPQTLNRYSYVLNNPLRLNDPTGHVPNDPQNSTSGAQSSASTSPQWMTDILSQMPALPTQREKWEASLANMRRVPTPGERISDFLFSLTAPVPPQYDRPLDIAWVDNLTFKVDLLGPGVETGVELGPVKAKVGARLNPDFIGDRHTTVDSSVSLSVPGAGFKRTDSIEPGAVLARLLIDKSARNAFRSHASNTKFEVGHTQKLDEISAHLVGVGAGAKFSVDQTGRGKGTLNLSTPVVGLNITFWDTKKD